MENTHAYARDIRIRLHRLIPQRTINLVLPTLEYAHFPSYLSFPSFFLFPSPPFSSPHQNVVTKCKCKCESNPNPCVASFPNTSPNPQEPKSQNVGTSSRAPHRARPYICTLPAGSHPQPQPHARPRLRPRLPGWKLSPRDASRETGVRACMRCGRLLLGAGTEAQG